jgi:transposase
MRESTTFSCVSIFAGIDYHKKFSLVTIGDESGAVITQQRLPNDRIAIKEFFADFPTAICAVESCRGYEWFVDYLKDLGHEVRLVNAYKAKLIAQSKCKTDKIDSRALMQLLAKDFLPTCYQPSPAERRLRERLRWRAHLVRYATRMKVRIHSLLDKENAGLSAPQLFSTEGKKFLRNIQLSDSRKALLMEHLDMLDYFEKLVTTEDAWVKQTVKGSESAQLLTTIPGVGNLTALVILAELGDITRFKTAKQVVSYAGLVPAVHSSADTRYLGPITKEGSKMLRWMLIQAAWIAVRTSPQLRVSFMSVRNRNGKNPGVVSVARKLLKIAYRVLRDQKPFNAELVSKPSA